MGNSESSSSKSKRVLQSRFDLAAKTGVLNLSDQDIKPNSLVLQKIGMLTPHFPQSLLITILLGQNGLNIKIKTFDISGNSFKVTYSPHPSAVISLTYL